MVDRFRASGRDKLVIVVACDFDPEGEDIPNSFGLSLRDDFGIYPDQLEIVKASLTYFYCNPFSKSLPRGGGNSLVVA